MINRTMLRAVIIALVSNSVLQAFVPSNTFRPYDQAIKFEQPTGRIVGISAFFENGFKTHNGHNTHGKKCNVLQVYDAMQSLLSAIDMPMPSQTTQFAQLWQNLGCPLDDGQMGNVQLTGSFKDMQFFIAGGYEQTLQTIPGVVGVRLYVPIVNKKISDIQITDLTPNPASLYRPNLVLQAQKVKTYMADFEKNVASLGGPSYDAWQKTGLGDIALMIDWHGFFEQDKQNLKNVTLFAQLGISLPTGDQRDEDQAFSMPMGNDGAWGLPVGIGMHLDFLHYVRAGLEADFLYLFDKRRVRRMKTDTNQTEFLLLNKGDATREHGLQWQFHLFLEAYRLFGGFSAKAAYQFVKKDRDNLTPRNNNFNFDIVNSAKSLQEHTAHNLIFSLYFDSAQDYSKARAVSQIGIFYKHSLDGKSIINNDTLGAQLALHF